MKSMNRTVVVGVESVGQVNASSPLYRVTIPVINVFTGTSTHSLERGGGYSFHQSNIDISTTENCTAILLKTFQYKTKH